MEEKVETTFKDKVDAIETSLKKNDKRLSDKTAQKSAEKIAGSMIKNESMDSKNESTINLINGLKNSLGITDEDIEEYYNEIKFKYNNEIYFAKPRALYQADIYNEKHEQIGWGVSDNDIKEEVFTDYITNKDFIYELVGGEYAGTYTREEAENLPIKRLELTNDYSKYNSDNPDAIQPRKELQNQLQFNGYLGPMWGGIQDDKCIIRYETQEVYDMLSENKSLNEIALKAPNAEIEKRSEINLETIRDLLNEIDDALSISEISEIAKRFKNEIDRKIIEDEITSIEDEYYDVYEIDEDSEEYEDILNELKSCILSDFSGEEDNLNESKKLQEDEIIDRPEDLIRDSEEDDAIHHNEDKSDKTVIDYLEERIGQEIDAGRLNSILQSIFGMYNRTFIMPDDLYNMDLDSTQTLNIDIDGDEYTIYYDIIDVDAGLIKITDIEVL